MIGESCSFGSPGHAGEFREFGKIFLTGPAHFFIGLDSEDTIAVLQQQTRKYACTGGDVDHYRVRCKTALVAQHSYHLLRISRPVADIILYARGKTLGGFSFEHCATPVLHTIFYWSGRLIICLRWEQFQRSPP